MKGANDMANITVRLMDKDEDYKKMGTKSSFITGSFLMDIVFS